MKIGFYSKIASDNIKKNPRLYIPRILAESGLLGCFYIMVNLAMDDRLTGTLGGSYLPIFMIFGAVVLGLLSFILILYVNSFLMKQRKSEYGLYNVLGMEKRHINRVLFSESLFASVISLVLGTVLGMLFYKFASLLICRLFHIGAVAGFYYIRPLTTLFPMAIYAVLDIIAFVINSVGVLKLNPVELLAGKHSGEKEPKVKALLLILGVLTLGSGYFIALTVKSPLEAIIMFFVAVILVIIGTYCLFAAGTTFVLKCLKRNKKYYYNKKHMPAVSGLLYRMKQNAVGLASIAILSTGVLVMISTTVSLYCGMQDTLDENYPRQLYISGCLIPPGDDIGDRIEQIPAEDLYGAVRAASDRLGVVISDYDIQHYLSVSYVLRDGKLMTINEAADGWTSSELTGVIYITADMYNALKNNNTIVNSGVFADGIPELADSEIALCPISFGIGNNFMEYRSLSIGGRDYTVKERISWFPVEYNMGIVNVLGIVVANDGVLDEIYRSQKEGCGGSGSEYTDRLGVSYEDEEAVSAVGTALDEEIFTEIRARFQSGYSISLDTKWDALENVLGMYGTFLFLGILLGMVCLFSTILIIYYKQISEGYEDRENFQIMQKIGMEQKEVRKTISAQLVMQFFLPLITAGIHTAVAFPILLKFLKMLMLTNTGLFVVCSLITFAVFALVYTVIYLLTARTYYRIVH